MSLFIAFILAAVLLGAGGMLSPAWRTAQPRVALAATLCLALICGGAVFYAAIFGWITLGVDYLLFALLAGVVLGGTLSTAQARAEARGERLTDRDQGWPGPEDLAFFALVSLLLVIPLLRLHLPLGEHGQALALQSEAIREGDLLAQFSPGFHALSAYLSQQLGQPVMRIQQSAAAVIVLMLVWLAYDFGAELRDKKLGRAMALATMLCGGLGGSLLDGHYSQLLGLLFALAFLLYALRLARRFHLADMVAARAAAGRGRLRGHQPVAGGFDVPGAVDHAMLADRFKGRGLGVDGGRSAGGAAGSRALAGQHAGHAAGCACISRAGTASSGCHDARARLAHIAAGCLGACALAGRADGRLRQVSLLMAGWLLLIMDFALLGIMARILPLGGLVDAGTFARHAVILPFSFFGGLALLHLWESRVSCGLRTRLRRNAWRLMAIAGLAILALFAAFDPALDIARAWLAL